MATHAIILTMNSNNVTVVFDIVNTKTVAICEGQTVTVEVDL